MSCSSTRNHEVVSRVCDESYMYGVRMVGSTDAKDHLQRAEALVRLIRGHSATAVTRPHRTVLAMFEPRVIVEL